MSLSRGEAYSILELPIGVDPDSIRQSYKRLATKCHPEKHRGSQYNDAFMKFQLISQAYKRLITDSDVTSITQKEMYDLYQQTVHKTEQRSKAGNNNNGSSRNTGGGGTVGNKLPTANRSRSGCYDGDSDDDQESTEAGSFQFECGGMVLEEAPGKLCESFRLFLQGMGYIPTLRKSDP